MPERPWAGQNSSAQCNLRNASLPATFIGLGNYGRDKTTCKKPHSWDLQEQIRAVVKWFCARSLKCWINVAFTDVQLLMHLFKFGFTNAHLLGMFSDYETRVCECVLHQLRCNNCSKRICAPVTQICVLVDPILCLQWYKKYIIFFYDYKCTVTHLWL